MKISVLVKPNARLDKIERIKEDYYLVWVKEKPKENKANQAVVEVLSAHLGLPKSRIALIKGRSSKHKVFSIE